MTSGKSPSAGNVHGGPVLPIDAVLEDVAVACRRSGVVVVEASPGAGKTTRIPPVLDGTVVVLEPRRLAARLAAQRVAAEQGEPVGETVGYQVRHDVVRSQKTRVLFMTEAVLTRRLMSDPTLSGVNTVVVDEVHERHLHTDLAVALVDRLRQTSRPDLKLVIMSATLDGASIAKRYDAERVCCEVSRHPVEVEHLGQPSREPLDVQVATAVRRLCRDGLDGHVLVFLPGVREIRDAIARSQSVARDNDLVLLPLHGRLSARDQDQAIAPSRRRKIIFATNVAESSITIDGVAAVIDSGLARVPRSHPGGIAPTLETLPISQASATQRAGRAGRTRSGRCVRLYTERELARAPKFGRPEIERADLAELALAVRIAGHAASELRWLSDPVPAALEAAERLLVDLGALGDAGVTPVGHRLARFPLHPRLGRALIAGEARGVGRIVADIAALVSEGARSVDVWSELDHLDKSHRAWRASRQIARLVRDGARPDDVHAEVGKALIIGMRERVARRTAGGELAMADGGRARFRERVPTACGPDGFTIVLDAMGRDAAVPTVRAAFGVRSDWVLDAMLDEVVDERALVWNDDRGRVESVDRLRFLSLTLEQKVAAAPPGERTGEILAAAAWDRGLHHDEGLARLRARLAYAATRSADVTALDDDALRTLLATLASTCTSLDELRSLGLVGAIDGSLPPASRQALSRLAPARVRLANGIELPVTYPADRDPFVESYMQDFFGLAKGPDLAGAPLVVHLWAPNRRAEQVTRDLESFWREHYPVMFKRLSRRYPRHHWPTDPVRAKAVRLKRHQ